jgi:hypothetical protein
MLSDFAIDLTQQKTLLKIHTFSDMLKLQNLCKG